MAANVAVGGNDLIGKALAGWPALSMLAAVKLLFSMIDHSGVAQRTAVQDNQRPSDDRPTVSWPVQEAEQDDALSSVIVPARRADDNGPSASDTASLPTTPASGMSSARVDRATRVDARDVAHLVSAARTASAALAKDGRSLSRDNLADRMRDDGHAVSNARAGALVRLLRAEEDARSLDRRPVASVAIGPAEWPGVPA